MVKANDTDVVVIAVSVLEALQELGLQQLWVAFGQRQNLKWIPVHDLCCTLAEKSKGMLFFHAFTGCDVVSAFRGMFVMRLSVFSANSAFTHLHWMMRI